MSAVKLSALYLKKIRSSRRLMKSREACDDVIQREVFAENARELEIQAGHIAHCIAMFGNMNCKELVEKLSSRIERQMGVYSSPWRRGLHLVRAELFK